MEKNQFIEVFKNKSFLKLWGSQLLSQMTLNMLNFLIIIKIFERTHSTMSISMVWIFYAIPAIIMGPFSGIFVDLITKRKALIYSNFINGLIVLLYLLVGNRVYPIYAIIFLYSTINQLYVPAEASTLPSVISKNLLPAANTVFLFTIYVSFILGFGISGPILKIGGNSFPFILASAMLLLGSYFASRLPEEKVILKKDGDRLLSIIQKLKEGYQFITANRLVMAPLVILISAQVIISLFTVIFPAYSVDVLKLDLRDAGPQLIIPLGLGAVFGALGLNRIIHTWRKRRIIAGGAFLASFSLFLLAIIVGYFREMTLFVTLLMFLLGLGVVAILVPTQTFLQEQTPTSFRARVFGTLGFLITLASLPPVLFAGAIADLVGVTFIMVCVGIITFSFGVFVYREKNVIF